MCVGEYRECVCVSLCVCLNMSLCASACILSLISSVLLLHLHFNRQCQHGRKSLRPRLDYTVQDSGTHFHDIDDMMSVFLIFSDVALCVKPWLYVFAFFPSGDVMRCYNI